MKSPIIEKSIHGATYRLQKQNILERSRVAAKIAPKIMAAAPAFLAAQGKSDAEQLAAAMQASTTVDAEELFEAALKLKKTGFWVESNGQSFDLNNDMQFQQHFDANEKSLMPALIWVLYESIRGFLDLSGQSSKEAPQD